MAKSLADIDLLNQSQTNPTGDSRKPAPKADYASKLSSDATSMLIGAGRGLTTDLVGAPVDIVADAMRGMGVPVPASPIGGSKHLRSLVGQPLTDSPTEAVGNVASGLINPAAASVKGVALAGIFLRPTPSRFNAAETMRALGADEGAVFEGTSVFKGLGKQPRVEIQDNAAKLTPTVDNFMKGKSDSMTATADQVLKHDRLYADPEIGQHLKDMRVKIHRTTDKEMGAQYNESTHSVEIYAKANATRQDIAATLLHEMQHAVQSAYGMQLGGNPEALLSKLNTDTLQGSQKIMADTLKASGYDSKGISELLYWGMAGEVEAREVAKRYGMTYEQLKKNVPTFDVFEGVPSTLNFQGRESFDTKNIDVPNWDAKTWYGH